MTASRPVSVQNICHYMQQIAPLSLAEDWDNVGLLLGDEETIVARVMTCLTLTPEVAEEAIELGARLVVTHHPLLFSPVKRVNSTTAEGRLLLKLMQHGMAVYSPHTAYDNAETGINQQLAELMELTEIAPLRTRPASVFNELYKIETYVPELQLDVVRQALWDAGAGALGNYRNWSFNLRGSGTFLGTDKSRPSVGQVGRLEHVEEISVAVVCPANRVEHVVQQLRLIHPYESPAIDVISLKGLPDGTGTGRYGRLSKIMSLGELNQWVGARLSQPTVQFVGDPLMPVEKLGIACGSAAEFLRDAHRLGCQALLTGEARFHACLEARDLKMAMILPGHFATERPAMEELACRLASRFPGLIVTASVKERDPVQVQE
ncbi:MAG: Nif3-like dinuclear metal center hexameric protein [Planctomycetales bacterium]|nr:Nif3-like dinuclear metal center hexameric protein [Planctomycetales bacterium]